MHMACAHVLYAYEVCVVGSLIIDTEMRPPRLAVQNPLAAIDAGYRSLRRAQPSPPEMHHGPVFGAQLGDFAILALDPIQDRFRRRHHASWQAVDALNAIFLEKNTDHQR